MEIDLNKTISDLCERFGWDYADQYGEPGYSNDGVTAVVLGSYWMPRTGDSLRSWFDKYPLFFGRLEEAGVQFEWYDEWAIDFDGCSKAYRTQPDSYSWQPSIVWTEYGEMITPDHDAETWIEYAQNEPTVCIPDHIWEKYESDFADLGWERLDETFESGWHPGQNDDPKEIYARLESDYDVMFRLDGTGQFDVRFSAYVKTKDVDL